jgi:hypothetical protein
MSRPFTQIFVLVTFLFAAAVPCLAAPGEPSRPEPGKPEARSEPNKPTRQQMWQQRVDRAMDMIKESDPNKARVMAGLRTSDPNRFNRELREFFAQRMRDQGFDFSLFEQGAGGERPGGPGMPGGMPGEMGPPGGDRWPRLDPKAMADKEREDFMKWMKANYPEEEKNLAELRKKDPKSVDREMMQHFRQYMGIYIASKYSPKLVEILKQDLPLRKEQRDIITAIDKTSDAAEKAKLTERLRGTVARRFDLLVQQKQLEYDMLLERLKTLEDKIKESKAKVDDMKLNSKQHIEKRMNELLSRKGGPEDRPSDRPEGVPQGKPRDKPKN